MKLTTRQDIAAPLDFVYAQLTDFDHFERMAMRRGAEVERTDRLRSPGVGMAWRLRFVFRGRPRTMQVRLAEVEPGAQLIWAFDSPSLQGTVQIELVALSPRRTRMTLRSEVRPKTLAARLLVQSARLAKGRVQKKLDAAGSQLAAMIEEQARGPVARV
mgnify:FL=1|jgi:uncharacterized protein YndB with AHSA1/START domain